MEDHYKLLRTEDLHSQCIELIKNCIVEIQQEICMIKKFLGDQKKQVIKRIRVTDKTRKSETLECTRIFYKCMLKELMNVEEACEEYLLRLKIDLLTAAKRRMQSPPRLSLREARKVCGIPVCCNVFDETKNKISCRYTWENVSNWCLEDTRNIMLRPKETMRTEFDESDLKFKQDMIYFRTKMFFLPRKLITSKRDNEIIAGSNIDNCLISVKQSSKSKNITQILNPRETSDFLHEENDMSMINSLKFIDGKFKTCNIWLKILDAHGNQYGSKWHLALCPQIEKIVRNRHIPAIHLSPHATLNFISKIQENGARLLLLKEDLIPLLVNGVGISWLKSWKLQFQTIDGKHIAATFIQAFWRGYWLRKRKLDSERLYIAASFIWFSWITLKKRRELHQCYLTKMLMSLQATRELSLKLSKEFSSIFQKPHIVLHLPSLGFPVEMRTMFATKTFAILENMQTLRICFVRNPMSEVIYILPVKPTRDLLMMYSDFIEAISPEEDIAKRITFIALSQAETFKRCTLNLSRILHCSEESLNEIRKKIADKPAYFLPSIIDECDMRLAGNLNVALLSPGMNLQRKILNISIMSEMIDTLGLLQPPHAKNIYDYDTLCATLAHLIVLHTEVCVWLLRLNFGLKEKHCGRFLINHISVPFMPILRREREKFGDKWIIYASLREEFLNKLIKHLPKVVHNLTRLSKLYDSWKEFYSHIQKFGCLLQAVPAERNYNTVAVCLFIPEIMTKERLRWLGTADKLHLETTVSTPIYMMPQTSLDVTKLRPVVNKFARGMQSEGYFGYLTIIFYCYMHKYEEKLEVMVLNVYPYYSYVQSYIDWMKFAIGGMYNAEKNQFVADVSIVSETCGRRSYTIPQRTPKWNETTERYGIAISQLYNTGFSVYSWSKLKDLFEGCGIMYNAKMKQGSSILLYDSESKNLGLMVAVTTSMKTTLSMVHNQLTKLHQTLMVKSKKAPETNLSDLTDFFAKLSPEYQTLAIN